MKKRTTHVVSLTAIMGWIMMTGTLTHAQSTDALLTDPLDQSAFPVITAQPTDQSVLLGSSVALSVQANNADGYQWLQNGVPLDGQTNNILVIANAGIGDVGLYSCEVMNGDQSVPTRVASVTVEVVSGNSAAPQNVLATTAGSLSPNQLSSPNILGGSQITVFGTPIVSGGKKATCPGTFTGCVAYTKTASQGWGWAPISGAPVTSAADGSGRTDTKVEYVGLYGDHGCAQTSVSINPVFSPAYRFTIYFTNNIPTNAYPITLTGFNP